MRLKSLKKEKEDLEDKRNMKNKYFYNSITINLPKNILQFLTGIILYFVIFKGLDFLIIFFAYLSFILIYSSVYLFNDIMDYKEDRKDKEKIKWKLIAKGELSIETAVSLMVIFIISGFSFAFFVNNYFFYIMLILLFLNFLHSSKFTRFKKSFFKTSINMTFIEFLKFSSGWFVLTTNLSEFPFWLILSFSLTYTIGYIIYKFKFNSLKIKENLFKIMPMSLFTFVSFILSILLYDFSLSLFLLLFLSSSLFSILIFKLKNLFRNYEIKKLSIFSYVLFVFIIVSLLLITNPIFSQINEELNSIKDVYIYKFQILTNSPIADKFEDMSQEIEKYKNLEDLEKEIKNSTNLLNLTNFDKLWNKI